MDEILTIGTPGVQNRSSRRQQIRHKLAISSKLDMLVLALEPLNLDAVVGQEVVTLGARKNGIVFVRREDRDRDGNTLGQNLRGHDE